MLNNLRRFAKSSVAAVFIGLLVVSFAAFGINDVFTRGSSTAVMQTGDREIAPQEFKLLFDNLLRRAGEQSGRPLDVQEAARQGFVQRLLDDLALSESFAEMLERTGVHPSDQLVARLISRTPLFFNQITGAFDRDIYQRQLSQNGLTEERYEGFLRDEQATQHFAAGVVAGMRAPALYGALPALFAGETRSISYLVVSPEDLPALPPPTDAELRAFLQENADRLTRPELRALSLVRFSAAEIAPTLAVNEAEARRQFEFRRETLSEPERRTFTVITAGDQAAAQRAAGQLRGGQQASAVAKGLGRDPVSYTAQPRSAIADRRVGTAAFAMPAAGVSQPFQSDFGWSVVKLDAIQSGRTAEFDQVRPLIERDLRQTQAQDAVVTQVEAFEEAIQGGQTLAEAARTLNRPVLSLPPVTAQGTNAQGQPTGLPEPMLEQAFALTVGAESDVIEAGPGEYFVLRVDRITPKSLPPIDEVRAPLTEAVITRRNVDRLRARAEQLAGQLKGARPKTLDALAGETGTTINRALAFKRDAAGRTLSRDLVGKAFGAKIGDIITAEHTQLGFVVARVDAAQSAAAAEVAAGAAAQRAPTTNDMVQAMGDFARSYARTEMKAKTYLDRARQAVGLSPEDDTAPPAAAGADKKA